MTPRPQLQIFRSIVVTYAILVMNRFVRFELSAKHIFHNRAMFWLLITAVSLSTGQHYVAVFVDVASARLRQLAEMGGHANAIKGAIFFGLYLVWSASSGTREGHGASAGSRLRGCRPPLAAERNRARLASLPKSRF